MKVLAIALRGYTNVADDDAETVRSHVVEVGFRVSGRHGQRLIGCMEIELSSQEAVDAVRDRLQDQSEEIGKVLEMCTDGDDCTFRDTAIGMVRMVLDQAARQSPMTSTQVH